MMEHRPRSGWDRRERIHCVHAGFTLLELVVAIGIIALLLALLIPAVQTSRGVALRASCSNHLHQLGLALQQYEGTWRTFPMQLFQPVLPYVDQSPLYDEVASAIQAGTGAQIPAKVPVFLCPSDPFASDVRFVVSYSFNDGSGRQTYGRNGYQKDVMHELGYLIPAATRPADYGDGLSNTAILAERLVRDWQTVDASAPLPDDPVYRRRILAWTTPPRQAPDELDEFADACEHNPQWARGTQFVGGVLGATPYVHILPPNKPSCANGNYLDVRAIEFAAFTASSLHGAGAHVLLGDGAVRFVSESVSRGTWRAIGSRDGSDLVGEF